MKLILIFLFVLIFLFSNLSNARYIGKDIEEITQEIEIGNDKDIEEIFQEIEINNDKNIEKTTQEIEINNGKDIEEISQEIEINDDKDIEEITQEIEINYHFADADEGATLLLSNQEYFDNMNQNDINYRLQKLNGTIEELKQFAVDQILDFTDEEKVALDDAIDFIKKTCKDRGYTLPPLNDVVFIKTTQREEAGGAYTHGTQIYLGDGILEEAKGDIDFFRYAIGHELFHCLTRNSPEFRKDMYSILGFTVVDQDFEFPKEVSDLIISNPDVEHHNSYATFEINGEKRDCVAVYIISKPFEEPDDKFINYDFGGLVPIDDLSTIYSAEDATNYWDVYGENTEYTIDPEEGLADNFGLLMSYGLDGIEYQTPRIVETMDAYLRSYKF